MRASLEIKKKKKTETNSEKKGVCVCVCFFFRVCESRPLRCTSICLHVCTSLENVSTAPSSMYVVCGACVYVCVSSLFRGVLFFFSPFLSFLFFSFYIGSVHPSTKPLNRPLQNENNTNRIKHRYSNNEITTIATATTTKRKGKTLVERPE